MRYLRYLLGRILLFSAIGFRHWHDGGHIGPCTAWVGRGRAEQGSKKYLFCRGFFYCRENRKRRCGVVGTAMLVNVAIPIELGINRLVHRCLSASGGLQR